MFQLYTGSAITPLDLITCHSPQSRVLVCKNDKNKRVALYSIFIDPSDYNYFAVSGRDQYARCVRTCTCSVYFEILPLCACSKYRQCFYPSDFTNYMLVSVLLPTEYMTEEY